MYVLSEHTVFIFILQLGIILLSARILGQLFVQLGQPIIVGEVFAGILLGPLIFGNLFPHSFATLFPQTGEQPYLLQGISWLCVLFLLLITGLEVDVRAAIRQSKQSLPISLLALVCTFVVVYFSSYFLPEYCFPDGVNPFYLRLFVSIALSVVAIPVIAKILFDMRILRSDVGLKVLMTGVLSDIWGWTILAMIISLVEYGDMNWLTIVKPLFTMMAYIFFAYKFGAPIVDKLFDCLGCKNLDTTTVLSIVFALALLNSAIAHMIGIHVVFGAFIAGVMAGESDRITPYIRQWIQDFIFAIFAPIFFVLIGMQLKINRLESLIPIVFLLVFSSVFRISGAYLGGVWGGLGKKNAFAIACGLNTQGTMGIIIALIAYEMGIFNEDMFSIIVIICVLTSLFVGPLLKWAIKGVKRPLANFFDQDHVFLDVEGETKTEVIENIVELLVNRGIAEDKSFLKCSILEREASFSTAIGKGVAVPHIRLMHLKAPILCFFRLNNAIDYDSPDNKPVQLIFLELMSDDDDGMHLNLISQVTRFVSKSKNRDKLLECTKEEVHSIMSFDEKA